jgi:SpoU rRNA methylase family enzyme
MKPLFSGQIFEKYSNIIFHENPSSGRRVVSCGQTDGQTDMKLIVTFRNLANASKNGIYQGQIQSNSVITTLVYTSPRL